MTGPTFLFPLCKHYGQMHKLVYCWIVQDMQPFCSVVNKNVASVQEYYQNVILKQQLLLEGLVSRARGETFLPDR